MRKNQFKNIMEQYPIHYNHNYKIPRNKINRNVQNPLKQTIISY